MARRIVREIADEIAHHPTQGQPIDLALFWAYVAGAFDDVEIVRRYDRAVGELHGRIERGVTEHHLFGGLAGAGWILQHISDADDEALVVIDEALLAHLAEEPWTGRYDLISGLVGFGVYFVERCRASQLATPRRGLERVLAHLAARARPIGDALAWHTPRDQLPGWKRERSPAGHFDLGLAHGSAGPLALAGAIADVIPEIAPRARELGCATARWLATWRVERRPEGELPSWVVLDAAQAAPPARAAWCYGDPGIAIAGWSAAVRLGEPVDPWRDLAHAAAVRAPETTQIRDPNLCHGAAGLAHICNRFYQASHAAAFRDAAIAWFDRALAMRRQGQGIAGFTTAHFVVRDGRHEQITAPDILEGAAGVALALLAAVGDEEPGWDRMLLCDLPPLEKS